MDAVDFPESNITFNRPPDLAESQCLAMRAWLGYAEGGSMDGERMVVVAWKPTSEELAQLAAGQPVFLTVMGGLPPHFLTTDFEQARRVA